MLPMYFDVVPFAGAVVTYLLLISFQQVIFPSNYFSLRDTIYTGKLSRAIRAFALRALIILVIMLLGIKYFNFHARSIQLGIIAGGFLCVWPSIYLYGLLSFITTRSKSIYFLACCLSLAYTIVITRFINTVLFPLLFDGYEVFILSNIGINMIYGVVSFLVLPWFSRLISKGFIQNPDVDQLTFPFDLYITYRRMEMIKTKISEYHNDIDRSAKLFNIDYALLYTVIQLEYINRGSFIARMLEKLVCVLLPQLAISRDFSVGLTQIKIRTAASLLNKNPHEIIRLMLNPSTSIDLCARFLRVTIDKYAPECGIGIEVTSYADNNKIRDLTTHIASEYLCGTNDSRRKYVFVYSTVLERCGADFTGIFESSEDDSNG